MTGSPDDYLGEDCLSIYINDGYWNDNNCENKRGYVCKRRGERWREGRKKKNTQRRSGCRHVFGNRNTFSCFPLPGLTPEPPPPHDGKRRDRDNANTHLQSGRQAALLRCFSLVVELGCGLVLPVQVSIRCWCAKRPPPSFTAPTTASSTSSRLSTEGRTATSVPTWARQMVTNA